MTEDEMVGRHHRLSCRCVSKLGETVKDKEAWHATCSPWSHKESDVTEHDRG